MSNERARVILGGQLYEVERFFGQSAPGVEPAQISQIAVDSHGFVHVLRRGAPPISVYATDGAFAYAYGMGEIFDAHGIAADASDRILVADRDAHQILIFSRDGSLRQTRGERHTPRWR